MEIVHYPHPALFWKSQDISRIDDALRATVEEMFELMYKARGIGLAANQVALPWRFFIINITGDPKETDEELVFINPVITNRKGSMIGEEGCLSLPELYADVRRAEEIIVEAFDLEGQPFRANLSELAARVVQHETDHLDGVLFVDRVDESLRRELEPDLEGFEAAFRSRQSAGEVPADEELKAELQRKLDAGG